MRSGNGSGVQGPRRVTVYQAYNQTSGLVAAAMILAKEVVSFARVVLFVSSSMVVALMAQHVPLAHTSQHSVLTVFSFRHTGCSLFHAAAILQMCAEAEKGRVHTHTSCAIETNMSLIFSMATVDGAEVMDVFAAPFVHYKDRYVGQSVAATILAGDLLGFPVPLSDMPKATQYMLDLRDFVSDLLDRDLVRLSEFQQFRLSSSGRLAKWMGNFERSIVGPYVFGNQRTYVDYYFVSMFRWVRYMLSSREQPIDFPSSQLLRNYPMVTELIVTMGAMLCVSGQESITCEVKQAELWYFGF